MPQMMYAPTEAKREQQQHLGNTDFSWRKGILLAGFQLSQYLVEAYYNRYGIIWLCSCFHRRYTKVLHLGYVAGKEMVSSIASMVSTNKDKTRRLDTLLGSP
ncbi:hypothetical protein FRX31_024097 [Thalictrum thalictroides]|uniref:Uncharacterized protein n=1 Tax=Thalictrum thalictroides TaxID=46969 RepID=A0A7J6VP27_THATH|nr:hypothetical protein FRX31_024097 [Thalictrum thalictroides]